ncbi:MAG: J domain-containing protein [Peptococcaceae bacterium]|nr:J domain-containing protein [Peptococcaceae bacterium]
MTDPRKLLGVGPHASAQEIRRVYKQLVKMHHPDVGGHPERFKEITEAYLCLCAVPTYPALSGVGEHRVRVVYGRRATYHPSFLWVRKLLLHKIVWQAARTRVAIPVVIVLAVPIVIWPVNPYVAVAFSIVTLVGCKTTRRRF